MNRLGTQGLMRALGWAALPGSILSALVWLYMRTYAPWARGWPLINHSTAGLFLPLIMWFLFAAAILVIWFLWAVVNRQDLSRKDWLLMAVLSFFIGSLFVPPRIWAYAVVGVVGPEKFGVWMLDDAVNRDDYRMARYLVARGVHFVAPSPRLHMVLARGHSKDGEFDEAIAEYRKANELTPNDAGAILAMAEVYERKGDLRSALEMYQEGCVQFGGKDGCTKAVELQQRLQIPPPQSPARIRQ